MKKTSPCYLFTLILLVMASYHCFGQTKNPEKTIVTLNRKSVLLPIVLADIEKQTGYKFNYDSNEININQSLSSSGSSTLADLLKSLSDQLGLDFEVSGNAIAIRKGIRKVRVPKRSISGRVTDRETGSPLPGVNVFIKGTRQGAVTNNKGEFIYQLNEANISEIILVFNYIGMKPQEVKVGKQVFFSVVMENDSFGMDEIVVTGSYTRDKRREDVVGSIAQVSAQRLQTDRPIESFDKMLEGLVAGVQVETTTELNTPVKIYIRGQGSLPAINGSRTTSSQPLYVIDGIPIYEQQRGNENSSFSNESYLNPLSSINPDDIKSISILKDATASALYGANAANGVIIITTKGGKEGRTAVNFSYDTGVAQFINKYKWLSGPQYYSLLREAYINDGVPATLASQQAGSPTTNTDWLDLTSRNAIYHNAAIDISGGSPSTTFRFSTGYRDQQSSALNNDLTKIYLRLKVDHKISDKFSVGFNLSPTVTKSNTLSSFGAVILPPNLAPFTNGTYTDFLGVPNPVAVNDQNESRNQGMDFIGNINASYKINNEIAISGTFGANAYQNKQTQYLSALNATGSNLKGSLRIFDRNYLGYTGFVQATYDKTFKRNTINFVLGTQVEDNETNLLRGSGTGFTFDRLRTLNGAASQTSASSKSESATVSYYSQLGYDLDKKYYLNVNARIDKSSIFGGDKQVALNGSLGLAWIVSKEDFLRDNKVLNLLKLRTTYGSTGNSRIGNYSAKGLYDFGTATGNTYAGNFAANPDGSAAPNPDLGWEKNYKLNFGVDVELFNKIQITAEYYNNTIHDLISSVIVPLETGFGTISANTSKTRNQGFELSIGATVIHKQNFDWRTSFNLGTNKNKLLSFNNGFASIYGFRDDANGLKEGNSMNAIYGFRWAGVNPETGLEQFYDANGQLRSAQEINALPLTETSVLGDRLPNFQGGFFNNFDYKNFSFSFNILYSYGADQLFNYADEADGRNLANRNQSVNLVDRWQRPDDITDIPKLSTTRALVSNSSRYLYDVSYLKLSNVSLSYKFADPLTKKLRLNSLSVFANGNNLFYVYKDAGTKGRNGIAERRFVYPETMAFTAGIKVGL
ncbi:SusC/RagA family TonB-linked outer membrane protein [Pedobacter sp. N23S346]|uniref:SusC/RagA family TonB-linked outer membrane protein n=1 Tax=Pedobacter sp. N23S346 TaxID=3402750 RepID=UPI003AD0B76E